MGFTCMMVVVGCSACQGEGRSSASIPGLLLQPTQAEKSQSPHSAVPIRMYARDFYLRPTLAMQSGNSDLEITIMGASPGSTTTVMRPNHTGLYQGTTCKLKGTASTMASSCVISSKQTQGNRRTATAWVVVMIAFLSGQTSLAMSKARYRPLL